MNDCSPEGSRAWQGEWRTPRNLLHGQRTGSVATIHDDATAAALGFARGTIEGPTHFSQLTPGLVSAFGSAFFESGRLSVHYRSPAFDGDRLRARVVPAAGGDSASVSVTREDGTEILSGTADVGHTLARSETDARIGRRRDPVTREVLNAVSVGDTSPPELVRLDYDVLPGPAYPFTLTEKLAAITEPDPWYRRAGGQSAVSPWGSPILPLEMISVLLQYTSDAAFPVRSHAVGLFLDQEIDVVRGPVRPDHTYALRREVLAFSGSSRTESYWVRTTLEDPGTDDIVAIGTIHVGFFR